MNHVVVELIILIYSSKMSSYIAHYVNPFIKNDSQPKIPDGKMESSIGQANRRTLVWQAPNTNCVVPGEIIAGPTTSYYTTFYAVMYPGLAQILSIHTIWTNPNPTNVIGTVQATTLPVGTQVTAANNNPALVPVLTYPETAQIIHTHNLKLTNLTTGVAPNIVNQAAGTFEIDTEVTPSYWRMVSQGLRIDPVGSESQTSGFFETVSLPCTMAQKYLQITKNNVVQNGVILTTAPALRVNQDFVKELENNLANWRDSPSYATGPIADLVGDQWHQLVNDTTHSPTFIDNKYETDNPDNLPTAIKSALIDENFQMRIFRFRCPPQSRFVFQMQTNYEFQYWMSSPLKVFQTLNHGRNHLLEEVVEAQRNMAAAPGRNIRQENAQRIVSPLAVSNDHTNQRLSNEGRHLAQHPQNMRRRFDNAR